MPLSTKKVLVVSYDLLSGISGDHNTGKLLKKFLEFTDQSQEIDWVVISNNEAMPVFLQIQLDELFKKLNVNFTRPVKYTERCSPDFLSKNSEELTSVKVEPELTEYEQWRKKRFQVIYDFIRIYSDKAIDNEREFNYVEAGGKSTQYKVLIQGDAIAKIKLGNTFLRLALAHFSTKYKQLHRSYFRLFQIIVALDQLKVTIPLNDALKKLGILEITAPEDYAKIAVENIILLYDAKNYDYLSVKDIGFITKPVNVEQTKNIESQIILYPEVAQLIFSDDVLSSFNQFIEEEKQREELIKKVNVGVAGKVNLTDTAALRISDNNSYLNWIAAHASGIRSLTRFSHWHHGASGRQRAEELLKFVNDPEKSLEEIRIEIYKVIKASGISQHSLSRYLYSVVFERNLEETIAKEDTDFEKARDAYLLSRSS